MTQRSIHLTPDAPAHSAARSVVVAARRIDIMTPTVAFAALLLVVVVVLITTPLGAG